MIPYEVDPSLHTGEPEPILLDDGFSPRSREMSTHPVEPEPTPPGPEPAVPNTTHLPVEPDFGPALPPLEPEDPRGKPPTI